MVRRDKRREFFRGMNKKKEIYPKKERDKEKLFIMIKYSHVYRDKRT